MLNVLGQALRLVLPGLLLGVTLAMVGNRLLGSLLFEVKPSDPTVLIFVSCSITTAAFAASFLPAFRASRFDPLVLYVKTNQLAPRKFCQSERPALVLEAIPGRPFLDATPASKIVMNQDRRKKVLQLFH